MGSTISELLAALPIREQPTVPPETGAEPAELAFFGALLAAMVVIGFLTAIRRRRRSAQLAFDESRARAAMDELCRHGWTAQLTVFGTGAPLPEDAPDVDGVRVRIDWTELTEDDAGVSGVAVARRVWSRSIDGALRRMVEDRRIDLQLEEIERAGP